MGWQWIVDAPVSMQLSFKCFAFFFPVLSGEWILVLLHSTNRGRWRRLLTFSRPRAVHLYDLLWNDKESIFYILSYHNFPKQQHFVKPKPLVLLEHNSFPCLMWRLVFLPSDATMLDLLFVEEKWNMYTLIFGYSHFFYCHQHFIIYLCLSDATV